MCVLKQDTRGVSPAVGTLVLITTTILAVATISLFAFGVDLETTTETAEDILEGEQSTNQNNGGEQTSTDRAHSETTTTCLPEEAATPAKANAQC